MASPLVVDMLGAPIGIDLSVLPEEVQDEACAAWVDALAPTGAEPVVTVTPDSQLDGVRALEKLSQQVTLAGIHLHKGTMWMLHAAGIADDDGRVLVFVGPSGRGKTTASIALGREFGYVSDETVGIAADGSVYAYRKPLSIIETPGAPKVQRSPSSLGLRPLPDAPLRLARVILLDRRDDGPDAPVESGVSLIEAIEHLVPQSSSLVAMDAPLQFIAARAAATSGLARIEYREAETMPEQARSMFVSGPSVRADAAAVEVSGGSSRSAGAERYWRRPYVDAVTAPTGQVVVLQRAGVPGEGVVRILDGIAPTIWVNASFTTVADLELLVRSKYGDPPVGTVATGVRVAIGALVAAGVLTNENPAE